MSFSALPKEFMVVNANPDNRIRDVAFAAFNQSGINAENNWRADEYSPVCGYGGLSEFATKGLAIILPRPERASVLSRIKASPSPNNAVNLLLNRLMGRAEDFGVPTGFLEVEELRNPQLGEGYRLLVRPRGEETPQVFGEWLNAYVLKPLVVSEDAQTDQSTSSTRRGNLYVVSDSAAA
jgi:hypothetical protein